MKTKIFCDSADFKTIKKLNNNPLVAGFTTNPSLMRLAGAKNYKNYSLKLLSVCKKKPISLEVFGDTYDQFLDLNIKEKMRYEYTITKETKDGGEPEIMHAMSWKKLINMSSTAAPCRPPK